MSEEKEHHILGIIHKSYYEGPPAKLKNVSSVEFFIESLEQLESLRKGEFLSDRDIEEFKEMLQKDKKRPITMGSHEKSRMPTPISTTPIA